MADCVEKQTGISKFLSILPVATVITIIVLAISFGVAWGQIREEVTTNKEIIKEVQVERIKISNQLSELSTDVKWLRSAIDRMAEE